jgi:hypothetical protein
MDIACKRRISSVVVALLLSILSHGDAGLRKAFFDLPAKRDGHAITPADQLKLKQDLTAARDR